MYYLNSVLISAVLFILIVLANEAGLKVGEYFEDKSDDDVKSQTTAIQGGIIGLLALILGFTFNMSLQRYDARAAAEIAEANAIGTVLLRTKLLKQPYDNQTRALIKKYIALRLEVNDTDLTQIDLRNSYNKKVAAVQEKIWQTGIRASEADPNPVTTGYFIQAVNDMIDAQGKRNDQLQRHVPPAVFYLLFIIFIATSALTGYASGLGRRNSRVPGLVLSFLIALLVFIIIDLDRPRRGVIEVRQDSMESLG